METMHFTSLYKIFLEITKNFKYIIKLGDTDALYLSFVYLGVFCFFVNDFKV